MVRRFTMQDRSTAENGVYARTDPDLSLAEVYLMTDYTDEEFNKIVDLAVGETLLIGYSQDISVERTQ